MGHNPARDLVRDDFIRENGFKVLRIAAARVIADATGTAEAIVARAVSPLHRPADGPPPRSGEAV
jgi:very-short-patch-repair endonuclease